MSDLNNILAGITGEINTVLQKYLTPQFEIFQKNRDNMSIIENILKEMPEFKKLERENMELKRKMAAGVPAPKEVIIIDDDTPIRVIKLEPVPQQIISLEVIERALPQQLCVIDDVNLNVVVVASEAEASEAEASEADEVDEAEASEADEAEASEADEAEASEADEAEASEAEASEAEASEAEASEADEADEETGVEEASEAALEEETGVEEASEADEAEAEEEEASEAEEEEASEAEASEAALEEASEAALEADLGVFMIELPNYGNCYTTSETNGEVYSIIGDEEVGDIIGHFKNGVFVKTI
jgi:hypothetical protein